MPIERLSIPFNFGYVLGFVSEPLRNLPSKPKNHYITTRIATKQKLSLSFDNFVSDFSSKLNFLPPVSATTYR